MTNAVFKLISRHDEECEFNRRVGSELEPWWKGCLYEIVMLRQDRESGVFDDWIDTLIKDFTGKDGLRIRFWETLGHQVQTKREKEYRERRKNMGWGSATEIFDNVAEEVFKNKEISSEAGKKIIKRLVVSLQTFDWDTECESNLWCHPMIREIFKETNPDWDWKDIDEFDPVEEEVK